MANVDKPSGLKPVGYMSGAPWNGEMNVYQKVVGDAELMFKGDLVILTGACEATGKYPTITQYDDTDTHCLGVAWGFSSTAPQIAADPANLNLKYSPTLTMSYVYVIDSPFVLYEMQEDSGAGAIAVASIGLNCELIGFAGNTTTGLSAMELDSSDVAGTATLPVRVLRLIDRENNAVGNHAKWLVKLNTHTHITDSATGVTGV